MARGSNVCGPETAGEELVCPPPAIIVALFGFWTVSTAVGYALHAYASWFRQLKDNVRNQRNCIGYVMNLIVTTVPTSPRNDFS